MSVWSVELRFKHERHLKEKYIRRKFIVLSVKPYGKP